MPAVNLLVRQGEMADVLVAAEKLVETGVSDFLLIPTSRQGSSLGAYSDRGRITATGAVVSDFPCQTQFLLSSLQSKRYFFGMRSRRLVCQYR
jgi:hypothetical protein